MEDIRVGNALVITCNDCSCAVLQTDCGRTGLRSCYGKGDDCCAVSCSCGLVCCHGECQLTCNGVIQLGVEAVCSACCKGICNISCLCEIEGELHAAGNLIVLNGVVDLNGFARSNLNDIVGAVEGVGLVCRNEIKNDIVRIGFCALGCGGCFVAAVCDFQSQSVEDIRIGNALFIACNDCSCAGFQTDCGRAGLRSCYSKGDDCCAVSCSCGLVCCHGECQLTCNGVIQLGVEAVCSACCKGICNISCLCEIEGELHAAGNLIVLNGVVDLNGFARSNLNDIVGAVEGVGLVCRNEIKNDIVRIGFCALGCGGCFVAAVCDFQSQSVEDIRIGNALFIACNDCSCTGFQTDGRRTGCRSLYAEGNDG